MEKKLKALVTGGTGFIGSHLVDALLREGWDVRCLVRKTSPLQFVPQEKVELVKGDLEDGNSLREGLVGVDHVFHLAGRIKGPDRESYFRANREGTKNLLEAARAVRPSLRSFIYVSSLSAAGPSPDGHPLTEDEEPRPVSFYGESKLAAEREVTRFSDVCPVVIIRPAAVYGPRDGETLRLIRLARRGFRVRPCREGNFLSTVHVSDLTDALIRAARKAPGRKAVYFIGDGAVYSLSKTFDTLFEIMGRKPAAIDLPWGLIKTGARLGARLFPRSSAAFYLDKIKEMGNKYWVCDSSRAQKELGFAPRFDLTSGLKNTISWYREEGWLS